MTQNPNSFSLIRSVMPSLTDLEREVARWLLENPEKLIDLTLAKVSSICGVSDTTVLRVCRAAGFNGFSDTKIAIVRDLDSPISEIGEKITEKDDIETIFHKVFQANVQGLNHTLEILDVKELEKAVDYIESANKILIIGVGPSDVLTHDLRSKLIRLGKNCSAENDSYNQLIEAALLTNEDLVIVFSLSGMSTDPIDTIKEAKRNNAKSICITGNPGSSLASLCDITLTLVHQIPWIESMASRVSEFAIIETLYVALIIRNINFAIINERLIQNALVHKGIWKTPKIENRRKEGLFKNSNQS